MSHDFQGPPNMLLAGVMGWPVSHSRSPRLHGYWLKKYGINGAYLPLAVRPQDFEDALRALPKLGFRGANVTVPHKEAAFHAVHEADAFAVRVKAVNTVIVRPDGTLLGRNTDGYGFIENLKDRQPLWRGLAGPAVVIGAGGAARGIVAALLDEGVPQIRLLNRTEARAEQLALELDDNRIFVTPWTMRAEVIADAALLVNATTLGMSGGDPLDLDLYGLNEKAIVYDIVYTPLQTPLLVAARMRGNPVVDGLGMLLHQARPGFEAWFGVMPEVTEDIRQFMLAG